MMERKFLFDRHIFDAPPKEEVIEDLPPPPPVFSEEELTAAKDIARETGRQQGRREEKESREQVITSLLARIADQFSHLFAAESVRESIFEKESLRLCLAMLDVLFPVLQQKIARDDLLISLEQTLTEHRKTKEILIKVPNGFAADLEPLIARIRAHEQDPVLWRIIEIEDMAQGDAALEWADGGAVRDTGAAAMAIRKKIEDMLNDEPNPDAPAPPLSEAVQSDVRSKDKSESKAVIGRPAPYLENEHE